MRASARSRIARSFEQVNLAATPLVTARSGRLPASGSCISLTGIAVTRRGLPLLHELPVFKSWQGGEATMALLGHERGPTISPCADHSPIAGMRQLRGLDGLFGLDLDDRSLGNHRGRT